MPNLLLKIKYDGTRYHGWQVQKNALSIQEVLQNAIEALYGERLDVKGCSRTDSGVHAEEFCVSFHAPHYPGEYHVISALNNHLPCDIKVFSCEEVPEEFHARYAATAKEYVYRIWNGKYPNPFYEKYALHYRYPIDLELLNQACACFEGKHDFLSFCSVNSDVEDTVRTIYSCKAYREGELINIVICGDGFLYNMVRIMIGTLLNVVSGKIKCDDIASIIVARNRKMAGKTMPAKGLFLNRVFYGEVR